MKLKGFVGRFIKVASAIDWESPATKMGCEVFEWHSPGERYEVDFASDFGPEGWQQFDTSQDASYFGVWLNPKLLVQLTYCEGDWTLVQAPDRERYNAVVENAIACYQEGFVAIAFDDDGSKTTYRQDRAKFFLEAGP